MTQKFSRFQAWWNTFFLAKEVPYGLALVRMTLPWALLVSVLPRWRHARELFSTDGAPTPIWVSYGTSPLLPDLPAPVAVGLYSLLVFCLVTVSIGWRTRLSLVVSTVLFASFGMLDMVSTLTKYTVLASHVMLLLALSDCGAVWSVDAWLKRPALPSVVVGRPLSAVWPRRLLQLLLALCYLGAAFTKMHTPAYFSGDQMQFWLLANMNFENRVGEQMSLYPAASVVAAYITILWEVLFVALIWRRPWLGVMLGIGIVFHVMSSLLLGLIVFPLLCLSLYLMFVEQATVEATAVTVRRLWRQRPQWTATLVRRPSVHPLRTVPSAGPVWLQGGPSLAAFALLACLATVGGVEVEYHLDHYQERGANGPLTLKALDPDAVQRLLGAEQSIRPQDFFFAVDVGTCTVGGQLLDRRREFSTGETALLQCSMAPPHPDMWVEVTLEDRDQRVLRRFGQIVPRETLRSNFTYVFDDSLTSGAYDFVVRYDHTEVARRRIDFRTSLPPASPTERLTAAR